MAPMQDLAAGRAVDQRLHASTLVGHQARNASLSLEHEIVRRHQLAVRASAIASTSTSIGGLNCAITTVRRAGRGVLLMMRA